MENNEIFQKKHRQVFEALYKILKDYTQFLTFQVKKNIRRQYGVTTFARYFTHYIDIMQNMKNSLDKIQKNYRDI